MKKLLPKTKLSPQGFTLIELMVAISIVAILSVIGITAFTAAQKNARDTKRKGDIEAIHKAYEATYTPGATAPYRQLTNADFASGAIPTNPGPGGATYATYVSAAGAVTYMICATLENTTGNATSMTGTGLGTTTTGTHYCRQNAQ